MSDVRETGRVAEGTVDRLGLSPDAWTEGFGTFALPVPTLTVVLGLAALAGILAAVRPARRAARLDILSAISTD